MVKQTLQSEYRNTDVGVIPEDWEVVEFGDLIVYTKGFPFRSADYQNDGIRIVRVSDTTFNSIKDEDAIFVDSSKAKQYGKWRLLEDDLIFSTVGSKPPLYDSMVGRVIIIDKKHEGDLLNQNAVIIRAKKKTKYEQKWMLNHFRTKRYLNYIETIFRGNANQASITLNDLFKFQLALPKDEAEQAVIAQVLSDADDLIESLDKLIEKKKNIKQGAMQELLTGKKRLPGFHGQLKDITLLECTDCLDNVRIPLNETQRLNMKGDYPYCGANGILDYINDYVIDDDIILIAEDGGYFDEYQYRPIAYKMKGKCWVNNHAHILKAKDAFFQDFIFYALVHKNILEFLTNGTRSKLNKSEMYKIEITFPPTKEEQSAIAQVLSEMDSEIEELKQKRDKYRQLKIGMMQQLLTGRIRLKWKN
jgi:type I restriction enzyme, S subunit